VIKIEKIEVWGFEHAIRGMRNPMNSWDKSDSDYCSNIKCIGCRFRGNDPLCRRFFLTDYIIGRNDIALMQRLYKAGTEHRKYLRQIFVSMDITAPLYWLKELETYKVGTVSNSCSTMHTIHKKPFEMSDFSIEHLSESYDDGEVWYNNEYPNSSREVFSFIVDAINEYRNKFLETNDKKYWWFMIQTLPSSYNQKRTITMNYENVMTIINQRKGHKLDEWNDLVEELYKLPYVREIRGE